MRESMPTELELAKARKAMDKAREEMDAYDQSLQDEQVVRAKAWRAAEKEYKELCAQMEEA